MILAINLKKKIVFNTSDFNIFVNETLQFKNVRLGELLLLLKIIL